MKVILSNSILNIDDTIKEVIQNSMGWIDIYYDNSSKTIYPKTREESDSDISKIIKAIDKFEKSITENHLDTIRLVLGEEND